MKKVILNADDFGYSKVFNESILDLIENHYILSTTVMVNHIDEFQSFQVKKLIGLQKSEPISVGLHIEFSGNNFEKELEEQYKKFISIFGFKPSHIDMHKNTYKDTGYPIIQNFCKINNIPARNPGFNYKNVITTDIPAQNGTDMSLQDLYTFFKSLSDNTTCEILFHPGTYDPDCKSSLNKDREKDIKKIIELKTLFDNNNAILISFLDLK